MKFYCLGWPHREADLNQGVFCCGCEVDTKDNGMEPPIGCIHHRLAGVTWVKKIERETV